MIQAERHFNRPLCARWGRLWRTPASLWVHWLSDTECECSPTPLGNCISCPVILCNTSISFFVHFCLRRWTAVTGTAAKLQTAATEVQNFGSHSAKMGVLDFLSHWNRHLSCFLIRVLVSKMYKATALHEMYIMPPNSGCWVVGKLFFCMFYSLFLHMYGYCMCYVCLHFSLMTLSSTKVSNCSLYSLYM